MNGSVTQVRLKDNQFGSLEEDSLPDSNTLTNGNQHEQELFIRRKESSVSRSSSNDDKLSRQQTNRPENEQFIQRKESSVSRSISIANKPSRSRRNIFYQTFVLLTMWATIGLVTNVHGPALLDLVTYLQTDMETIAVTWFCASSGYLIGCVFVPWITDKLRLRYTFSSIITSFAMSVCLSMSCSIPNLVAFCVFDFLTSVFQGMLDTGGHVHLLYLWNDNPYAGSVLQATDLVWSVGSAIGPMIIQQFLSPGTENSSLEYNNLNTSDLENIRNVTSSVTDVHLGFVVLGGMSSILTVMFFFSFLMDGRTVKVKQESKSSSSSQKSEQTKGFVVTMTALSFILNFCYFSVESTASDLVAVYVVEGLSWDKYTGSLITTAFWVSFCAASLLAIFLAPFISPAKYIAIDLFIICTSLIIQIAVGGGNEIVTWGGMIFVAFGQGSFTASSISFINEHVVFDGVLAASVTVGNCAATMTVTPLTGYIFTIFGPMSMLCILLVFAFLVSLTFTIMVIFSRRYSRVLNPVEQGVDDVM